MKDNKTQDFIYRKAFELTGNILAKMYIKYNDVISKKIAEKEASFFKLSERER